MNKNVQFELIQTDLLFAEHCRVKTSLRQSPFFVFYGSWKQFSVPIKHRTFGSLTFCDYLIQNSLRNLWKFSRKFRVCEPMIFTNFLINFLNKFITVYRWSTTHAFLFSHLFKSGQHCHSLLSGHIQHAVQDGCLLLTNILPWDILSTAWT